MPYISIIIPFYNTPKEMIESTIKSILNQTFKEFEIICINDGSSEEYYDILKNIERLDERIKIYGQSNQGVSASRNIGVQYAKGKYIFYVDADDFLLPWALEEAYKLAEENSLDLVIGEYKKVFKQPISSDVYKYKNNSNVTFKIIKSNDFNIVRKMYLTDTIPGSWARLITKKLAEKVKFPADIKISEDMIWNLNLLEEEITVGVTNGNWYLYYINNQSAVHKYRSDAIVERVNAMKIVEKILLPKYRELEGNVAIFQMSRISVILKHYFFHTESKEKLITRYKNYIDLIKSEQFSLIRNIKYREIPNNRHKIKLLLIRTNIIFWKYYLEKVIK